MRRVVRPDAILGTVLLGSILSCGSGDAGPRSKLIPPEILVSDGVRTVVNTVPRAGLPDYATVEIEPLVVIGGGEEGTAQDLGAVTGGVSLSGGGIAVSDARSLEVRYFDAAGGHVASQGGVGWDDGEFGTLDALGTSGRDTLWVLDTERRRITQLATGDQVVGAAEVPAGHIPHGRFADGSFLLAPEWSIELYEASPSDGVRRDEAAYVRWWPSTGDTVAVGAFPHDEMLVVEGEHGLWSGVPPFGRRTSVAVGPGRFYVGDQETFEIRGYDPDGTLRDVFRLDGLDLSITPGQVSAARRHSRARGPMATDVTEKFWVAVGGTRPAYTRILLDAAGYLWVAEHVSTFEPPRNWLVFSADGSLAGLVQVPDGDELLEVGVGHILARTGAGTRVAKYRLTRAW